MVIWLHTWVTICKPPVSTESLFFDEIKILWRVCWWVEFKTLTIVCLWWSGAASLNHHQFVNWSVATAKQDWLPCGSAIWPVGSVVRQRASDQPVRPEWVAGPHLRRLWPGLEPAGLQVSSTVCTGLPLTASSYSSTTRAPLQDWGSKSQLWPQEGAMTFLPQPLLFLPPHQLHLAHREKIEIKYHTYTHIPTCTPTWTFLFLDDYVQWVITDIWRVLFQISFTSILEHNFY